jgi:vitamin B12 transporter
MLRVVYFEMTTQNSVLYDDNSGLPYNTQSTENKGVETSYQAQWQSHRIKTSFVLQNPRSITYSEQLARRAKQYANLDISEQFEKYELGAAIYATAQRKDNHYNTEVLSPYALLSVYVAAPLDKNWTFRMRMDNAFDKDYQLAYGYNTPGRTLTATLSYQPK